MRKHLENINNFYQLVILFIEHENHNRNKIRNFFKYIRHIKIYHSLCGKKNINRGEEMAQWLTEKS